MNSFTCITPHPIFIKKTLSRATSIMQDKYIIYKSEIVFDFVDTNPPIV